MNLSTKEFENKIDSAKNINELRELLAQLPKTTFYDRLNELLDKYGMSQSQLQKATGITKSLVYDITSARGKRKPQRYQILKIALAMGLSIEETNELLKLANYKELYAKNKVDAVISYSIKQKLPEDEIENLLIDAGATFSLLE